MNNITDYGRLAYNKLTELNKRIEALEKASVNAVYNKLLYGFSDTLVSGGVFETKFKFSCTRDKGLKITFSAQTSDENGLERYVKATLNGTEIINSDFGGFHDLLYEVSAFCEKGDASLTVKISCGGSFRIKTLAVTVAGYAEYKTADDYVSCAEFTDKTVIMLKDYNSAYLFEYKDGAAGIKTLVSDVIKGGICKINNDYLAFARINGGGELYYEKYTASGFLLAGSVKLSGKAAGAAIIQNGNSAQVFAVIGGRIKRFNVSEDFSFSVEITGYEAKEISAGTVNGKNYLSLTNLNGSTLLMFPE